MIGPEIAGRNYITMSLRTYRAAGAKSRGLFTVESLAACLHLIRHKLWDFVALGAGVPRHRPTLASAFRGSAKRPIAYVVVLAVGPKGDIARRPRGLDERPIGGVARRPGEERGGKEGEK